MPGTFVALVIAGNETDSGATSLHPWGLSKLCSFGMNATQVEKNEGEGG
jgi:hypothetical protein